MENVSIWRGSNDAHFSGKTAVPSMENLWKRLEEFWNCNRGVAWMLSLTAIGLALWAGFVPQSPGVSVGLLALCAGIMSIRPQMRTLEKITWIAVLITFAVLEVTAIKRSDEESRAKLKEQNDKFELIADGLKTAITNGASQYKDTVDHINSVSKTTQQVGTLAKRNLEATKQNLESVTGGNSFVYIKFDLPDQYMAFYKRGNEPLYDVVARIRCARPLNTVGVIWEDRVWKMGDFPVGNENLNYDDQLKSIKELPPENRPCDFSSIRKLTDEPVSRAAFGVDFAARNGSWHEREWLRLVNGQWISGVRVSRLNASGKPEVLFEFIPPAVQQMSHDPALR